MPLLIQITFPFFWMVSQSCHDRGKAWRGFKLGGFLLPDQYRVVIQYERVKVQVWDTCEGTGQAANSWGDRLQGKKDLIL